MKMSSIYIQVTLLPQTHKYRVTEPVSVTSTLDVDTSCTPQNELLRLYSTKWQNTEQYLPENSHSFEFF